MSLLFMAVLFFHIELRVKVNFNRLYSGLAERDRLHLLAVWDVSGELCGHIRGF